MTIGLCTPGVNVLRLKQVALDYAMDEDNTKPISADMRTRLKAARAAQACP